MATMASAARDIPQASPNRDNLTVVADRDAAATVARQPLDLPTPPNSISPGLPAHGLKAQLQRAQLEPIDSDLDLPDSVDGHKRSMSPGSDASGAITPALLAKHHLPDILLNHGPLAIRHIMGYLTSSVPGFSTIPPAKARRITVGALEGHFGEGGGEEGDVEFEKVGWGRWDARRRGAGIRERYGLPAGTGYPDHPVGIPIGAGRGHERPRINVSSPPGDDAFRFSHDDGHEMPMMGNEVDNMSMDGSASASCSEAPEDEMMDDGPGDQTDDEDWAAMGAAALRAESYTATKDASSRFGSYRRSFAAGMADTPSLDDFYFVALERATGTDEREAVEALLRLGSV